MELPWYAAEQKYNKAIYLSVRKKIFFFNKGGLELGCLCSSSKVPTTELKRIEAELRARKTGFTYRRGAVMEGSAELCPRLDVTFHASKFASTVRP